MIELDFALFNLKHEEKRGLMYRKYFLDRLAPFFFLPRVERLIELGELNFRGCQISLPLGPGNLNLIEPELKQNIINQTAELAKGYELSIVAVDRRLKQQLLELSIGFPAIFGDNFIKALTYALTLRALSRRDIRRIIIVGEIDGFPQFIGGMSTLGVPISMQTINPGQYEIMNYHLLYERGYAISISALNPQSWDKKDLIFIFDPAQEGLAMVSPHSCCVCLTNNGCDLAPELENKLSKNGLVKSLYNLAPIMETCLLAEAGILSTNGEQVGAEQPLDLDFFAIQQVGDNMGLWDLFLDKAI